MAVRFLCLAGYDPQLRPHQQPARWQRREPHRVVWWCTPPTGRHSDDMRWARSLRRRRPTKRPTAPTRPRAIVVAPLASLAAWPGDSRTDLSSTRWIRWHKKTPVGSPVKRAQKRTGDGRKQRSMLQAITTVSHVNRHYCRLASDKEMGFNVEECFRAALPTGPNFRSTQSPASGAIPPRTQHLRVTYRGAPTVSAQEAQYTACRLRHGQR